MKNQTSPSEPELYSVFITFLIHRITLQASIQDPFSRFEFGIKAEETIQKLCYVVE